MLWNLLYCCVLLIVIRLSKQYSGSSQNVARTGVFVLCTHQRPRSLLFVPPFHSRLGWVGSNTIGSAASPLSRLYTCSFFNRTLGRLSILSIEWVGRWLQIKSCVCVYAMTQQAPRKLGMQIRAHAFCNLLRLVRSTVYGYIQLSYLSRFDFYWRVIPICTLP